MRLTESHIRSAREVLRASPREGRMVFLPGETWEENEDYVEEVLGRCRFVYVGEEDDPDDDGIILSLEEHHDPTLLLFLPGAVLL